MTRLKEGDLDLIAGNLDEYDAHLNRVVGMSLGQIARKAACVGNALIEDLLDRVRIAAVPVSSGLGVIPGFSSTISAILSHLGFDAFVTDGRDVTGIAEAVERGADILMLADDERFVAMVPELRHVVDNSLATALGFVTGLELMRGGLRGESVLVLGCGPVGVEATKALIDRGAGVGLYDVDQDRALSASRAISRGSLDNVWMESTLQAALEGHELIFDATNAGGFIELAHLTPRTLVAAPGVPCALTSEALEGHRDRVLHDALEIGTATMAFRAAEKLASNPKTARADRAKTARADRAKTAGADRE